MHVFSLPRQERFDNYRMCFLSNLEVQYFQANIGTGCVKSSKSESGGLGSWLGRGLGSELGRGGASS